MQLMETVRAPQPEHLQDGPRALGLREGEAGGTVSRKRGHRTVAAEATHPLEGVAPGAPLRTPTEVAGQ